MGTITKLRQRRNFSSPFFFFSFNVFFFPSLVFPICFLVLIGKFYFIFFVVFITLVNENLKKKGTVGEEEQTSTKLADGMGSVMSEGGLEAWKMQKHMQMKVISTRADLVYCICFFGFKCACPSSNCHRMCCHRRYHHRCGCLSSNCHRCGFPSSSCHKGCSLGKGWAQICLQG